MTNYAKKLKKERARQNLSLRALSEISGVPAGTIHTIETGKHRANFDTMIKLSDALLIPLDYLAR